MSEKQELPGLLNFLTVLTIVGSSMFMILAIYNFKTGDERKAVLLEQAQELENEGRSKQAILIRKQLDHSTTLNLSALFSSVICIGGALLMRRRKKAGFLVYLAGQLAFVAIPMIVLGFMWDTNLFAGLIALLFIYLYTRCLKHLD